MDEASGYADAQEYRRQYALTVALSHIHSDLQRAPEPFRITHRELGRHDLRNLRLIAALVETPKQRRRMLEFVRKVRYEAYPVYLSDGPTDRDDPMLEEHWPLASVLKSHGVADNGKVQALDEAALTSRPLGWLLLPAEHPLHRDLAATLPIGAALEWARSSTNDAKAADLVRLHAAHMRVEARWVATLPADPALPGRRPASPRPHTG